MELDTRRQRQPHDEPRKPRGVYAAAARMTSWSPRIATSHDVPAIAALMDRAIHELMTSFLSPAEVEASVEVMGLDTQLIADGTYFVVEDGPRLVGCGGWSRRATLYGGNHTTGRSDALLDPATEPARVRAMYTDPAYARRGIGRVVLETCEQAARDAGFQHAELAATLAGVPLYRVAGYARIENIARATSSGITVPLVRMRKSLAR